MVKLYHDGTEKAKWTSHVMRNTLTPVFNQDFTFDLADMEMNSVSLKITVKDKAFWTLDDVMGVVEFGASVSHTTGNSHWNKIIVSPYTRITQWHSLY